MFPVPLIYTDRYVVDLGPHVFPAQKYRLLKESLLAAGVAGPEDFVEPESASEETLRLVHTPEYILRVRQGSLSWEEITLWEIPWTPEIAAAAFLSAGGTLLAARSALTDGVGVHLGGGYHHAFPDHGEGFCVFNDVAVAIRALQAQAAIERAAVIDCDLHQGNGTAAIFRGDARVFTFSIHQEELYPAIKPPSTLDIGLDRGVGDEVYLGHLERHVPRILAEFRPDLVLYVAGADPYREDQLGELALTREGLAARDRLVLGKCRGAGVPVVVTLAGGYARKVADTVAIHRATVEAAGEVARQRPGWRAAERAGEGKAEGESAR